MRRLKAESLEEEQSVIDMTPMLDVVFIMLIFFIVTSSFVKESGIEINRPTAKTQVAKKDANIFVALSASGVIWIDKRPIDLRAVTANIKQLKAELPHASVVVQADIGSKSGDLIRLIDQIKKAGIPNVSVATKEE